METKLEIQELKDCLVKPSIMSDMKHEHRFPLVRPFWNHSITLLEQMFLLVKKDALKIKKFNGKLNRRIKDLKNEQKELDKVVYKMGSPEIDRSLEIDKQINRLQRGLKSPINEVLNLVELEREYARRHRKDYKELQKLFLDILSQREKEVEKDIKKKVGYAMKGIENKIKFYKEDISIYGTRNLSGKEYFKKELNKLIKKLEK